MFTYREISNTIDKLSLEMEKDLNAPVADPSLEMQFGDVIVSDDPVDTGSTYGIFGPSSVPPPKEGDARRFEAHLPPTAWLQAASTDAKKTVSKFEPQRNKRSHKSHLNRTPFEDSLIVIVGCS